MVDLGKLDKTSLPTSHEIPEEMERISKGVESIAEVLHELETRLELILTPANLEVDTAEESLHESRTKMGTELYRIGRSVTILGNRITDIISRLEI
ncbi:hypothetical protein KAR91_65810 [Candidatus Pacearchaeota archaeon]|nr:hypothetical protein [Candidatus Pacearchaeota archaeon]